MNLIVSDRDALLRVEPNEVTRYLSRSAWQITNETSMGGTWELFLQHRGTFEVLVPRIKAVRDYAVRISELLRTLSVVERRSQLDLYREITSGDLQAVSLTPYQLPSIEVTSEGNITIAYDDPEHGYVWFDVPLPPEVGVALLDAGSVTLPRSTFENPESLEAHLTALSRLMT
jgi:hypothetical protein